MSIFFKLLLSTQIIDSSEMNYISAQINLILIFVPSFRLRVREQKLACFPVRLLAGEIKDSKKRKTWEVIKEQGAQLRDGRFEEKLALQTKTWKWVESRSVCLCSHFKVWDLKGQMIHIFYIFFIYTYTLGHSGCLLKLMPTLCLKI